VFVTSLQVVIYNTVISALQQCPRKRDQRMVPKNPLKRQSGIFSFQLETHPKSTEDDSSSHVIKGKVRKMTTHKYCSMPVKIFITVKMSAANSLED